MGRCHYSSLLWAYLSLFERIWSGERNCGVCTERGIWACICSSENTGRRGFFFVWRNSPTRARAASLLRFLDHTQWHTTFGKTPLGRGSALCRDLWQHMQHSKGTYILAAGGISFCSCFLSFFFSFFLSFFLSFLFTVYLYIVCPHVTYSSKTHNTNIHAPGRIWTRNPSRR
jgi:hypothetical protein